MHLNTTSNKLTKQFKHWMVLTQQPLSISPDHDLVAAGH